MERRLFHLMHITPWHVRQQGHHFVVCSINLFPFPCCLSRRTFDHLALPKRHHRLNSIIHHLFHLLLLPSSEECLSLAAFAFFLFSLVAKDDYTKAVLMIEVMWQVAAMCSSFNFLLLLLLLLALIFLFWKKTGTSVLERGILLRPGVSKRTHHSLKYAI